MKKRIAAFLLSALLCLGLVGTALAAEGDAPSADGPAAQWTANPGATSATIEVSGLGKNQNYSLISLQLKPAGADSFNPDIWIYNYFMSNPDGTYILSFTDIAELKKGDVLRLAIPNGKGAGVNFVTDYEVGKEAAAVSTVYIFDGFSGTQNPDTANPLFRFPGRPNQGTAITGTGILDEMRKAGVPIPSHAGYTRSGWLSGRKTYSDAAQIMLAGDEVYIFMMWTRNGSGGNTGSGGSGGGGGSSTPSRVTVDRSPNGSVTYRPGNPKEGDTVTITVRPNSGYELDRLTVATRTGGRTIRLTKVDENTYTFIMPEERVEITPVFKAAAAVTPTPVRFGDVPAGHAFYGDISWVAAQGYMGGYSDGTFRPGANTTRQALWMVLARIDGASPSGMADARSWAVRSSVSDGSNPSGAMTRQQMVTMLYRYAQSKGYKTTGGVGLGTFSDASAVASYAQEAMSWAVGNGIVQGTGSGMLNPNGTATRAHFAAFLHRFCTSAGIA